jgi:nucleotide-binding universal stress UspA family protein
LNNGPQDQSLKSEENIMSSHAMTIQRQVQLKNIALLTDLGSNADGPLRFAASLAQCYGANLTVAHACTPGRYIHVSPELSPAAPSEGVSQKRAEEKIRALIGGTILPQAMVNTVVTSSSVAELLEQLVLREPDLLVLATHARSGISKWMAGSVTEEVFRKAKWPVLVLPPGLSNAEMIGSQFQRVLFMTDLSDGSARALAYAVGITEHHAGHMVALHVDHDGTPFYFERLTALKRLEEWLHRQTLTHQEMAKIECIVRFGTTAAEIKEAVSLYKVDLIVLGARGFGALSGLASHFVGGTAYEIACSSECPVLIVPNTD